MSPAQLQRRTSRLAHLAAHPATSVTTRTRIERVLAGRSVTAVRSA